MMVEWPKHVGVFLRNFKYILINDIEVVHVLVLTIEWPYYVHGTNTITMYIVCTGLTQLYLLVEYKVFST